METPKMKNLKRWSLLFGLYTGDLRLLTEIYIQFQTQFRTGRVCYHQVGHTILGSEAPRPQAGASRRGNIVLIVPLNPAYKAGLAGHLPAKSDMVESENISDPSEPDVKIKIYYTRKWDTLKLGEAQLDKTEYVFWRGKFAEARITAAGPDNFDALKKFLFEK